MTDYKAQITPLIHWLPLVDGAYIKEEVPKKSILVHHTAGNADPYAVIKFWNGASNLVSTAFVVGGRANATMAWKDGELVQGFSSKYWSYHLGLHSENLPPGTIGNKLLNAQAIGIEMCSWGPLTLKADGKYYNYVNTTVPADQVYTLSAPFRGFVHYHTYAPGQLATLKLLLLYLTDMYHIPRDYKGLGMFEVNQTALKGESGIWTHTSYRQDKFDCFPYPPLIQVLQEVAAVPAGS